VKILVIGSGGREHALAWRLAQNSANEIVAAPGNPGIAEMANCHAAASISDYLNLARGLNVDLTVVGPEGPLVAGVVDQFREAGLPIVGPTAAAAKIEGSKAFSKELMMRAGIPTARHVTVTSIEEARKAIQAFGFPVVLKADGLAAGKGVVIAHDQQQVEAALPLLLSQKLVIEEFLQGEEVSFIVLSDGRTVLPLQPSQDHKALCDGDVGPNTGGMGAYSDPRILTPGQTAEVMRLVIEPAIEQMRLEGREFTGFLYAGLMMTSDGPKVLEFNARLGDPETQVLLHRMNSDFAAVLHASAHNGLSGSTLEWKPEPSVCVVLAAHGYPSEVRTGDSIYGIADAIAEGAVVFHAGTRTNASGITTGGGRVLGVTASGPDLQAAISNAYRAAEKIRFNGMQYRHDIGAKGLRRWASA
jgi:phosphoribosylamine--glycine ligase